MKPFLLLVLFNSNLNEIGKREVIIKQEEVVYAKMDECVKKTKEGTLFSNIQWEWAPCTSIKLNSGDILYLDKESFYKIKEKLGL